MSRRFQFSLRDVLWLVLVVASFFGGMTLKERIEAQRRANRHASRGSVKELQMSITTPDGKTTDYVTIPRPEDQE